MSKLLGAGWLGALVFLCGCGDGANLYPVSGAVTLDGAPLAEGDIIFSPSDPKLAPEAGKIKDGKYEVKAPIGKMAVKITASKIMPGAPKGAMGEDVATQFLPAKYNDQTTLSADVTAGGPKTFDFPLDSK